MLIKTVEEQSHVDVSGKVWHGGLSVRAEWAVNCSGSVFKEVCCCYLQM